MQKSELKIGDVVEISANAQNFLGEIIGFNNSRFLPIVCLVPTAAPGWDFKTNHLFDTYPNFKLIYGPHLYNLNPVKMYQHKFHIFHEDEIIRKTDLKW